MLHVCLTNYIIVGMETKIKIGDLLKGYRKDKVNLSVRDAANLIGIHFTYLSRVENNMSEPSDEILTRIAEVYKLTPQEGMDLFMSIKMSDGFSNALQKLDLKEVTAIMYRRLKK